jgi:dUTP pyrophosphatase
MVTVKFKKIHADAVLPTKATDFSGGWDVTCTEIEKKADDFYVCKLGFAVALPEGYKLTLVPRSSLTGTKWILQNSPALGDSDYRGEYQLRFRAIPVSGKYVIGGTVDFVYPEFPFKVGDRVGQLYIEEVIPVEWDIVTTLPESVRGSGGFGSTGK